MKEGESKVTTSHEEIRHWAEKRDGHPAKVKGAGGKHDSGILRIDFGEPEESLAKISWDDFFEQFEDRKLAFLYQDKTAEGKESRFFKLVNRNTMDQKHKKDGEYDEYDAIEEEGEEEDEEEEGEE